MKQAFTKTLRLREASMKRLYHVTAILDEYMEQGYVLTLRQLFYQLVVRGFIPNTKREYAKLSVLLVKARMAGMVDWDAIEDRTRRPYLPYFVSGPKAALEDTIEQYRLDRQKGQSVYLELWTEKDALSGVLSRITTYHHIRLVVNRGYSSCSAMYAAAMRFYAAEVVDQEVHILYLGDHDPSGLDMLRDIDTRLSEFGVSNVNIEHIGLTRAQVDHYKPPPNPARLEDPRAKGYIAEHGAVSWEVDALRPDILNMLVVEAIQSFVDDSLFKKVLRREKTDKTKLRRLIRSYGEK